MQPRAQQSEGAQRSTSLPPSQTKLFTFWPFPLPSPSLHPPPQQARAIGIGQREAVTVPLLMRAAYGAARLPKLVVVLREPSERLHSAFWAHAHYRARYGATPDGYLAFVRDQAGALRRCVDRQRAARRPAVAAAAAAAVRRLGGGKAAAAAEAAALRRCALLFESLSHEEERVFFHADQVLRGLYDVFLEDWLALWPPGRVLVVLSEDWFERPRATLARVTAFLGLPGDVARDDALWRAMAAAERHRAPVGSLIAPLPEAQRLADGLYAPHVRALGRLLGLGDVSPWAGRARPWRPDPRQVEQQRRQELEQQQQLEQQRQQEQQQQP